MNKLLATAAIALTCTLSTVATASTDDGMATQTYCTIVGDFVGFVIDAKEAGKPKYQIQEALKNKFPGNDARSLFMTVIKVVYQTDSAVARRGELMQGVYDGCMQTMSEK